MSRRERTDPASPGTRRRAGGDGSPLGRAERSRLAVRLTPRASRDAIEGFAPEPDGTEALRVRVTAPPIEGRANAALLRLLARALGVPPSSMRVAAGARGRRKLVDVKGIDGAEARRQLARASTPPEDRGDAG